MSKKYDPITGIPLIPGSGIYKVKLYEGLSYHKTLHRFQNVFEAMDWIEGYMIKERNANGFDWECVGNLYIWKRSDGEAVILIWTKGKYK